MTPTLLLTPEQVAELNAPFNQKEAYQHAALGFAKALSENHILPSSLETMCKAASLKTAFLGELVGLGKDSLALGLTVGAVGGAYSGYLHNKINKILAGKDDPKVVELKRKIESYKNMSEDLKRTNAVGL